MSAGLSQATSQLKTLGTEAKSSGDKVKQSGIGIGAGISLITTNLVNTANSIISLNRQYQDLTKAQNNVKQSGFSLENAQGRLENAHIKLQKAQAGTSGATQREISEAKLQFKEDMKNAKSKLDVMKAHDKLNKVLNQGGKDTDKIKIATNNYERAQRGVASATINSKEAQIAYQRAQEDFYLQTIPTAIGIFGSFASVLQVVQGAGGIGGITSSFLKFTPVLIGISAAFLALKTNFLGITTFFQDLGRDIGNAVPELKPFLSLIESLFATIGIGDAKKAKGLNNIAKQFMDSFKPIIDFFKGIIDNIMHGNWSAVFDSIKTAAMNLWHWFEARFPLLVDVEKLIQNIAGGKWDAVFTQLKNAATTAWDWMKTNIPIFGVIDKVANNIRQGKWAEAFSVVARAAQEVLSSVLGAEWVQNTITKIQQIPEIIKANLADPKQKNKFAGTGIIDKIIGLDDWSVTGFFNALWKKITTAPLEGFDLTTTWGKDNPNPLLKPLFDDASNNATVYAKKVIDPMIKSLFEPKTWTDSIVSAGTTQVKGITTIITKIYDALFPANQPKGGLAGAGNAAKSLLDGLVGWFTTNFPTTTAKVKKIGDDIITGIKEAFTVKNLTLAANTFVDAIFGALDDIKQRFANIGITIGGWIYNAIPPWLRQFLPGGGGPNPKKLTPGTGGGAGRAAGFHGFATGPMLVGEKSTERIDVTPMSDFVNRRNQQSNGGGGTSTIIVYSVLDGQVIAESVARRISVNQAVYR